MVLIKVDHPDFSDIYITPEIDILGKSTKILTKLGIFRDHEFHYSPFDKDIAQMNKNDSNGDSSDTQM